MFVTALGTIRYADRFPKYRDAAFYRTVMGLQVSSLGIGTYLGGDDDAADASYTDALIAAGESGINFFDTAINYRNQRSERCVGRALEHLQRDEIVVCTKAGFLTPGALPAALSKEEVAGGMHCMSPEFLSDQIERSLANLRVETIDVFYLHNPETQLEYLPGSARGVFEARIRRAFDHLERLVEQQKIRWYGAATWDGFRKKGALSLPRLAEIATEAGGPEHHFRFIQLPFNLGMVEAFTSRNPSTREQSADDPSARDPGAGPETPRRESVLEAAARLGIIVVASATLLQTRVLKQMPDAVADLLPGFASNAQRAIQFTRSTPGISVALVGMGRREHVLENLGVAKISAAALEDYLRLYQ